MISIIIPARNEEKILEKTLLSLRAIFKGESFEIIVSDGKSTDRTAEIAKKYADKVVLYQEEARQTIAKGRNDGAKAAEGEYFLFLDADCAILNPDFLKTAVGRFQNDGNLAALTGRVRVLKEYETTMDRIVFSYMDFYYWFANNVIRKGLAPGEFQMMKREAFEAVHGFNERLVASEDLDMFIRLSRIGRTFFDSKLTIFHTGRRAHKVGWPRLLWQWSANAINLFFFGKAKSEEWTEVR